MVLGRNWKKVSERGRNEKIIVWHQKWTGKSGQTIALKK